MSSSRQLIESRALPCGFRVPAFARSRVHAFARSRVLSPRCVWLHVAPSFAPVEARSRCALTEPEHRAIERANAGTRERANENAQPITRSSVNVRVALAQRIAILRPQ